jgi:acyl-CoA dehydrogenase
MKPVHAKQALSARARLIAEDVARPAASSVDRDARFPHEAITALREEGLLAAALPRELGGLGSSLLEITELCTILGRACASTAAIFAMQQIQLATIARHSAGAAFFDSYLRDAAEKQWLVASGVSETGVGGDLRSSIAAIERNGQRFSLRKRCSVVSYGAEADAILITARRAPSANAGDQALALLRKTDYRLETTSAWNALGMRGTCSPAFLVSAEAPVEQILPEPFRTVSVRTFVPWSCIAWASGWLGIAEEAVSIARASVQFEASRRPGTTPFGGARLVDAVNDLEMMRASVRAAAAEYEQLDAASSSSLSSMSYALRVNGLKLISARLVTRICMSALEVCGLAGYMNDSQFSIGRLLRDALAAPLMIGNDRLTAINTSLLIACKDDSAE